MSDEVITYDRAHLKKGEKLKWNFNFTNKLTAGTTLTTGDITATVSPTNELTMNATFTISNLTVQVIFEAAATAVVNKEYECTVQASKNGEVAVLKLVLTVDPA